MFNPEIVRLSINNDQDSTSPKNNFISKKFNIDELIIKDRYTNVELLSAQFDLLVEKRNLIRSTSIINYLSLKTAIKIEIFEEEMIKCLEANLDEIVKVLIYSNFADHVSHLDVFNERVKIQML